MRILIIVTALLGLFSFFPCAQAEGQPVGFECRGSEPFWLLRLQGDEAVWESPENNFAATAAHNVGNSDKGMYWFFWQGPLFGEADHTAAFVSRGECVEPSGEDTGYRGVVISTKGFRYDGCCRPAAK